MNMFNYIEKKIIPPMPECNPLEVINAWNKINRIVTDSFRQSHLDYADNMLTQMIKHFKFSPEQIQSPLIVGMRMKINEARNNVI